MTIFAIKKLSNETTTPFARLGLLVGLLLFCSIIGGSLVAPMTQRFGFRLVLAVCMLLETLLLVSSITLEAATGGKIKSKHEELTYGAYSSYFLIIVYCFGGLFGGAVLTILKLAPRQIIGPDASKLQFLSGANQTCYEVAAIAGALCSGLLIIPRFGVNFPIFSLVSTSIAGIMWFFLKTSSESGKDQEQEMDQECQRTVQADKTGKIQSSGRSFCLPFISMWQGAKTLGHERDTAWILLAYPLTQYTHTCLEHQIAPAISKHYLRDASQIPILVAGSNFGELLGAIAAMFLQRYLPTPMPWLRLNALSLLLAWYFPFWTPTLSSHLSAWYAAVVLMPMGATWSAALVSLCAHLQKTIMNEPSEATANLSPLSCVFGFLNAAELTLLAPSSTLFGWLIDTKSNAGMEAAKKAAVEVGLKAGERAGLEAGMKARLAPVQNALQWVAGVNLSVAAILIMASTFISKGSFRVNPKRVGSLTEKSETSLVEEQE